MKLPFRKLDIYEGNTLPISERATNTAKEAVTPSSFEYRVDDLTNGREVKTWTSVTPGNPTEFDVTASDNALLYTNNEERRVTIKYDLPDGDTVQRPIFYTLHKIFNKAENRAG